MYLKFYVIFPNLPHPFKVCFQSKRKALAVVYREMLHMLPAKYHLTRPSGSGEAVVWLMGMTSILNFGSWPFIYSSLPQPIAFKNPLKKIAT